MNLSNRDDQASGDDLSPLENQLKEIQPCQVHFDAETILDSITESNALTACSSGSPRRIGLGLATACACGFAAGVLVTFVFLNDGDSSVTAKQVSASSNQIANTEPLPTATSFDLPIHLPLTAGNVGSRMDTSASEPATALHSNEPAIAFVEGALLKANATFSTEQLIQELLGVRPSSGQRHNLFAPTKQFP